MVRFLLLATCLLAFTAHQRPAEYDEGYSLAITAGDPRPAWPTGIFSPAAAAAALTGTATPAAIVAALRTGDVHPPLYFWALEYWRRLIGPGWFAARLLSVGFALAALAAVAWLARLTARPPAAAMALTLLSYGFAYTGSIARDIAAAQALDLTGLALTIAAAQGRRPWWAFAAGCAFGGASFTNYLAIFIAIAAFGWLAAQRWRLAVMLAAGIAPFIPADGYMYIAQSAARAGQFAPFTAHALLQLARDAGAALFGGLPLYAGRAAPLVGAALAVLLLGTANSARRAATGPTRLLIAAALATPCGLLALGLIFHTTPIEIRYLAFSLPPLALLLSTAAATWRAALLAAQAVAIAGLAFAPATMQPQQRAAEASRRFDSAHPLILVPFGNDGVGIPAQFMQGAAPDARLFLIRDRLPDLTTEPTILLATIGIDAQSRAQTAAALHAFTTNGCDRVTTATKLITEISNRCAHDHPQNRQQLGGIDPDRNLVPAIEPGLVTRLSQHVEMRDQPEP
jgi:hypothetical protein